MNKKSILVLGGLVGVISSLGVAESQKKPMAKPIATDRNLPLTQRPLTIPLNKLSNDIIHHYESQFKMMREQIHPDHKGSLRRVSEDPLKEKPAYIFSGKF